MWWGGFSETLPKRKVCNYYVLIPMWWGGFSEMKWWEEKPDYES